MNGLRRLSLTRQIIYLALIMLAVLLLSFTISNSFAQGIIERKVTASINTVLSQVKEKMSSFHSDMDGITLSFIYSPTVQNFMKEDDVLERVLNNNEVVSVFSNTATMKENIRGFELYDQQGKLITNSGKGTGIEKLESPPTAMKYSGVLHDSDNMPYYIITIPIYNLKNNHLVEDYIGACILYMDVNNFTKMLSNSKVTEHSRLLLLDEHNQVIASEGTSSEESFAVEEWQDNKNYLFQTIEIPLTNWKLISVIPKKELLQDLNIVKRLNIITYVLMFGMLCLFLLIFFIRILNPIKALMNFIKAYPGQDGKSRFNAVYHNEIGVLGARLNRMLDDIDALGKEVQFTQRKMYEIELAKKQMEISSYRNQINPHFLYNTLECIRAMAFYYEVEDIADISASLSKMFRYSVKGSDFVTLEEEIVHVKEYARIIEFRFRGKIQVSVEAEEAVMGCRTLKMLLQPIVENAVHHGLEPKVEPGLVSIEIRLMDRRLHFLITDNGCGMSSGRLEQLLDELHRYDEQPGGEITAQGIGLFNIYRRLKLHYGDQAEMNINSTLHSGTTVSLVIPAVGMVESLEEN